MTARKFICCAADIDRRDKRLKRISRKAKLTMHQSGKLSQGFCCKLYRKIGNINKHIAQTVSTQLIRWAKENEADVIVFENLKGWRPKGGKKKSTLRQRFHGWLHRYITKLTEQKFIELGGKVEYIPPRGTSRYAFDGSGLVNRSTANYALATFSNGKRYNCDLSASYNIAARYWAFKLKLAYSNGRQSFPGKSSGNEPRMPVCLSTLWRREPDAATTLPSN